MKSSAAVEAHTEQLTGGVPLKERNYYTTSRRSEAIKNAVAVLMLIAAISGWIVTLAAEKRERDRQIIRVIPMANQCIEWTGAGYNGVNAHGKN